MADSGGIRAGKAYVELSLQDKFTKAIDAAAKKLKDVGQTITNIGKATLGVGSAITAPLLIAAQRFASMGDEMNKASQRTGVGVQALIGLKYAAELSAASVEDLESGLKKMSKAIFQAETGNKEAERSLASIGLAVSDLKGLTPDEQFLKIADSLSKVDDAGARAALAMEIFGKGGTQLLPLMANGADGIRALQKRAEELGLTFGKEDAEAATKFHDILEDVWKQLQAVTFQAGAAVAQALQPFADAATRVLASVIRWVAQNRNLVLTVLGVGVALVTAGTALIGLGLSIKAVSIALSGITSTFSFLGAVVGLLTNPIVLVGAALVALGGYFFFASDSGHQVITFLKGKFDELKTTVNETVGGIADALAAGDIGLAAQILWAGLKLAWVQGTQELQAKWSNFKAGFVQVAAAAFYGALELWTNVKASLMTAWENTTAFLGSLWDGFIGVFTDLWNNAVNLVTHGLNKIKHLWDSTFDADAANKAADALLEKEKQARAKFEQDKEEKREGETKKNVGQIERDRQSAVKDINSREQGISAAADENARKEIADLEKQKQELSDKLGALRNKAGQEHKDVQNSLLPPKKPGGKNLDDIIDSRVKVTPAAIGTFNARAIQSLSADPVQVEIKKNTAETAKYVKKIVEKKTIWV
jgi:hypothetical protein